LYNALYNDEVNSASEFKYFYNLSQLFFPIKDNHLGFYQVDGTKPVNSPPVFNGNIDSLKSALMKKPLDAVEGIYYYDRFYSVGLYKSDVGEYKGVVLDSQVGNWKKGEIAIHLYEFEPNLYKAIYAHPKFKFLLHYPIEKFINNSLINSYFYSSISESVYCKVLNQTDYSKLSNTSKSFVFKDLNNDTQYMLIKNFSAGAVKMKESESFRDSIKNFLVKPNLFVDLRDNEGGAYSVAEIFLKLIQPYFVNGRVYVLINSGTISQGEIFTLLLKQLENVKILGQTTKGMLAYGSNYGKREKLPSQNFEIYITDLATDERLLPYENHGVKPDIFLSTSKDWIEQTLELIKKD
jgi:hypothetical protein